MTCFEFGERKLFESFPTVTATTRNEVVLHCPTFHEITGDYQTLSRMECVMCKRQGEDHSRMRVLLAFLLVGTSVWSTTLWLDSSNHNHSKATTLHKLGTDGSFLYWPYNLKRYSLKPTAVRQLYRLILDQLPTFPHVSGVLLLLFL